MTSIAIKEQVNTIKKATDKASLSKQTATEFLIAAGIVPTSNVTKAAKKKK